MLFFDKHLTFIVYAVVYKTFPIVSKVKKLTKEYQVKFLYTITCLKWPLKGPQNVCVFKTDNGFMLVKSIEECSRGPFCNPFDL